MTDLLSQDEIDALLHGVDDVDEGEDDGGGAAADPSAVDFDFSSNFKFPKNLQFLKLWLFFLQYKQLLISSSFVTNVLVLFLADLESSEISPNRGCLRISVSSLIKSAKSPKYTYPCCLVTVNVRRRQRSLIR